MFFFSSRRRHTRYWRDWSSDVCSSDLMATSIPPHNAAELCDAALYLISHPKATSDQLMTFVPGPDLPTGGIIVDSPAAMAETYRTGRGSFRVRRSEEHTSELQSRQYLVCRLLLEKKN